MQALLQLVQCGDHRLVTAVRVALLCRQRFQQLFCAADVGWGSTQRAGVTLAVLLLDPAKHLGPSTADSPMMTNITRPKHLPARPTFLAMRCVATTEAG